jgi:hypothetical protein
MGVFRRSLNRQNVRLTESTCNNCRSFVAASVRPELLDFIEKLHFCILQGQFIATKQAARGGRLFVHSYVPAYYWSRRFNVGRSSSFLSPSLAAVLCPRRRLGLLGLALSSTL